MVLKLVVVFSVNSCGTSSTTTTALPCTSCSTVRKRHCNSLRPAARQSKSNFAAHQFPIRTHHRQAAAEFYERKIGSDACYRQIRRRSSPLPHVTNDVVPCRAHELFPYRALEQLWPLRWRTQRQKPAHSIPRRSGRASAPGRDTPRSITSGKRRKVEKRDKDLPSLSRPPIIARTFDRNLPASSAANHRPHRTRLA